MATSSAPSPLKSAVTTLLPGVPMGYAVCSPYWPGAVARKISTALVCESEMPTAKSGIPSPLKSPVAMAPGFCDSGNDAAVNVTCAATGAARKTTAAASADQRATDCSIRTSLGEQLFGEQLAGPLTGWNSAFICGVAQLRV